MLGFIQQCQCTDKIRRFEHIARILECINFDTGNFIEN